LLDTFKTYQLKKVFKVKPDKSIQQSLIKRLLISFSSNWLKVKRDKGEEDDKEEKS